ncbi:hypothetical protein A2326_03725 [candidate division WWE3 bacterium RIFOXYB2_FULL_41_6]|nr:MAG: hypothetical protein A2181_08925 [Bdellovibrionales bacterium RIFOXYA1_FULL_38_20]OFZ51219.1 MAG: hypothetical protein A2417_17430 [Bdellovibrionales bacterium RIFOXYC1_FULL_37_79]OFZ60925.1 MAG: hypothetical protein A2381_08730 [Bdellovibrionales bacterium RIFOXYB1_FULL_37_110]OFZ63669.1 MAG: hypothetical protein A2577_07850 [Bdellovibrionales bacterium RIFOXYD1_FULL_36_51]OGC64593.1 MAG: hypothetical protein A2326_03725 [candidate division WWE3 bacterium RIFOXYB2_FULL_41_6]
MKASKLNVVTGILSPISWNTNNEVVEYSVYTDKDEDILLKGKNLDSNFRFFKNQKVKVSGNFLSSSSDLRVFQASRIEKSDDTV